MLRRTEIILAFAAILNVSSALANTNAGERGAVRPVSEYPKPGNKVEAPCRRSRYPSGTRCTFDLWRDAGMNVLAMSAISAPDFGNQGL